jgi:5-methylcytosine-specific restriction endonuclease McrA
MRQLTKNPAPAVLASRADDWRNEYVEALNAGSKPPDRWRNKEILEALSEETLHKCAYCEAVVEDVSYPHVDHILPKAARPDLVVEWTNLTWACSVCNVNKGGYYQPEAALLNPYEDSIPEHIAFRGPALFAALASDKGERTIGQLKLMRSPLFLERLRRIEALDARLRRWAGTDPSDPDRELRAELVRAAVGDDVEFSQCLRAFAQSMGFPF